jgi:competence protein ComEA
VGPALAQAIVKDRAEHGKFDSPDALTRVKGIGQKIVEQNRANILVTDPPPKH